MRLFCKGGSGSAAKINFFAQLFKGPIWLDTFYKYFQVRLRDLQVQLDRQRDMELPRVVQQGSLQVAGHRPLQGHAKNHQGCGAGKLLTPSRRYFIGGHITCRIYQLSCRDSWQPSRIYHWSEPDWLLFVRDTYLTSFPSFSDKSDRLPFGRHTHEHLSTNFANLKVSWFSVDECKDRSTGCRLTLLLPLS